MRTMVLSDKKRALYPKEYIQKSHLVFLLGVVSLLKNASFSEGELVITALLVLFREIPLASCDLRGISDL